MESSPVTPPPRSPTARPFNGLDRERLFSIFFFAIYFFLVYQLFRILTPFLAPLLGAIMLALVAFPLQQGIGRVVRRPTASAFITTLVTTVTVVVPVTLLTWLLLRELSAVIPVLREWLSAREGMGTLMGGQLPAPLDGAWRAIARYSDMIELDLKSVALTSIRELGNQVTTAVAAIFREFFVVLFQLLVLLLALFFFLRDGPKIVRAVMDLVPMEDSSKSLVLEGLDRTLVAMVRGTVITASAQGAMTGIGLALFGVPFPVLLGFVATFLAIVPFVGASLVWAPAVIYLLLSDHTAAALGLTVWGLIVVGLIDNFLRPMIVGGHARLPITLLFLGVIGGLQVYGLVGALISPLLIASVFAFAQIYRERYVL